MKEITRIDSNKSSVRISEKQINRFYNFLGHKNNNGCIRWLGTIGNDGYGRISINHETYRAHRIAWIIVNGPIEEGLWILHKCDNPICCNIDHLFLGSYLDNEKDKDEKNRRPYGKSISEKIKLGQKSSGWIESHKGEGCKSATLTEKKVLEIRDLSKLGLNQKHIAKMFNINQSTVSMIVRRRLWTHI